MRGLALQRSGKGLEWSSRQQNGICSGVRHAQSVVANQCPGLDIHNWYDPPAPFPLDPVISAQMYKDISAHERSHPTDKFHGLRHQEWHHTQPKAEVLARHGFAWKW